MNDIRSTTRNANLQDAIGTTIFANARVILADRVMGAGRVTVTDGLITAIEEGDAVPSLPGAQVIDCAGDYLMPGMIELHTDNIEKHIMPRPGAVWPSVAASIAHDTQIISAGITTVYDSVSVGAFDEGDIRLKALQDICDALETGERDGLFKARHLVHLRCEICFPDLENLLQPFINRPLTGLVSIMDHTPGQRQFVDESKYVQYYKHKKGFNDEQMKVYMDERRVEQGLYGEKNRRYAVDLAHQHGHALASHDDATVDHVAEAVSDRMTIAEFPTTVAAAEASHAAGLAVLMGAPNLVRGGSHSGNVAAIELARLGLLDIVSSDYVPASLVHSAFLLVDQADTMDLPAAVATVTRNPARAAKLTDRGEIAVGLKGDVVRVHDHPHHPILRGVWRDGIRVS